MCLLVLCMFGFAQLQVFVYVHICTHQNICLFICMFSSYVCQLLIIHHIYIYRDSLSNNCIFACVFIHVHVLIYMLVFIYNLVFQVCVPHFSLLLIFVYYCFIEQNSFCILVYLTTSKYQRDVFISYCCSYWFSIHCATELKLELPFIFCFSGFCFQFRTPYGKWSYPLILLVY